MLEVLIGIKGTRGDRPRKPSRFSTSYLSLYLHFLRVLNQSSGDIDWYLLRMSTEVHMYQHTVHMSMSSTIEVRTRRCHSAMLSLDWPACVFSQHYSLPGLEFDFGLGRARELLFSWAAPFDFFHKIIF